MNINTKKKENKEKSPDYTLVIKLFISSKWSECPSPARICPLNNLRICLH